MHITRSSFDRLVERAIAALPAEFAQWIDEVPIIVDDRPLDADRLDPDTVGLFSGHSRLSRSVDDAAAIPPSIHLFRIPLMEACHTESQLAEEIRKTLLHELGHYAGMEEADLDQLGYGDLDDDDPIEFDTDDT